MWKQSSAYHIKSTTGYHVCKAFVRGVPKYTAWAPRIGTGPRMLGVHATGQAAREECDEHAAHSQGER